MRNKLRTALVLFLFLVTFSICGFAQSAADNKFKNFNVKFQRGKSQAVKVGKADYDMSYVYNFNVRKGQKITVEVASEENDLTFNIVVYREGTLGYKVKQWTGKASRSGTHSAVIVMNNEKARNVPYHLLIKVE